MRLFIFRIQQTAGCIDILSSAGAYGGEDAMTGEVVAKFFHLPVVNPLEGYVGDLMETDQVDTTVESLQQSENLLGMSLRVVNPLEYDIFERQTTLVCEIVLPQQVDHLCDGHSLFCRHQLGTQFMEWGV